MGWSKVCLFKTLSVRRHPRAPTLMVYVRSLWCLDSRTVEVETLSKGGKVIRRGRPNRLDSSLSGLVVRGVGVPPSLDPPRRHGPSSATLACRCRSASETVREAVKSPGYRTTGPVPPDLRTSKGEVTLRYSFRLYPTQTVTR